MLESALPFVMYTLLAIFAGLIVIGIVRTNRGPRRLHDLAARLAARYGGQVVPTHWQRPLVRATEGPHELRVEWWKSQIGRNRRGPVTWLTLGPSDVHTAPDYPLFLAVGRHRGGYRTSLDLANADARIGDPEVDRVLRIHANDPDAVARFLGPHARARMVEHPEWETTAYRDGWSDDGNAPAVTLLRVMIRGHCHDERELDAARALLDDLAAGR